MSTLRRTYGHRGDEIAATASGEAPDLVVTVDGREHRVAAQVLGRVPGGVLLSLSPGGPAVVVRRGDDVHVWHRGRTHVLDASTRRAGGGGGAVDDALFAASPMTGVVLAVNVAGGDAAAAGDVLFVVEAMKMEFAVEAPRDVVVAEVTAAVGDRVDIGQQLVRFAESAGAEVEEQA